MSDTTPADLATAADRFRRAADGLLARIRATPADSWDNATPCPNWTARQVVAHVVNENRRMVATVTERPAEPRHGVAVAGMGELPEVAADADLAAAWADTAAEMVAAIGDPECAKREIPGPGGFTPFAESADFLAEDVVIHTWDLARGVGGDERLDEDLVRHLHAVLLPMDELLRQPWAFGPKVTPPPGADAQTEFLCFVGRRP